MTCHHLHVTAGIIPRQEKVLITRRPPGSHLQGFWEFPGGKQEPDEDLRTCLEREIAEELDIRVTAKDLFMTIEHSYSAKKISLYVFLCAYISGTPQAIGCSEFSWVPVEKLSCFSFPPPDLKIISALNPKAFSLSSERT